MSKDKKRDDKYSTDTDSNPIRKNYPTTEVSPPSLSGVKTSGSDLDDGIFYRTEEYYSKIVEEVIRVSKGQLEEEGKKKRELRGFFTRLFSVFIIVQFIALLVLILIKGFSSTFAISEALLTTYIVSVFVETLGIIAAMVTFVFNSKEEVNIINTLNAAIANYQKLTEKDNKPGDKES